MRSMHASIDAAAARSLGLVGRFSCKHGGRWQFVGGAEARLVCVASDVLSLDGTIAIKAIVWSYCIHKTSRAAN